MEKEQIIKLYVQCSPAIEVGQTLDGYLRVIPIIGGTFEGKINGKVVPGGADWNVQKTEFVSHASAKYVIQTEDGEYISIQNDGFLDIREPNSMKTTPRFQVNQDSQYAWLNYGCYVGTLTGGRHEGEVVITVYKMMEETN